MYGMTLEINQCCNLNCNYCYLNSKNGEKMSDEIAFKSVDLAFNNVKIHKDRRIVFSFVGGEVFMDFDLLKTIVTYIEEKNKVEQYQIEMGLTTNGTLLNEENINWVMEHNFDMKISLDGNRDITNMGRKSNNIDDVYQKILDNWNFVKIYEKGLNKFVQVTNVITKLNFRYFYESVKHLVETFKIKIIFPVLDINEKWDDSELEEIGKQIEQIFKYYKDRYILDPFYWSFIAESKDAIKEKMKFYSCGSGIIMLYIKTDGEFYPCINALQSKSSLGNINTGYDTSKINYLKNLDGIENATCNTCDQYKVCTAKGCIFKSLLLNNTIEIPNKTMCWMQKFKFAFYQRHKEELRYIEKERNYELHKNL